MASVSDFPAKGKIVEVNGSVAVFQPSGTSYSLHLNVAGGAYDGPINVPVEIVIRATGRKIWTIPSGGNFISPIAGTPKTVQGRVRAIEGQSIIVQVGVPMVIALPPGDSGIDLNNGSIAVGSQVNVMLMPGASFELAKVAAA